MGEATRRDPWSFFAQRTGRRGRETREKRNTKRTEKERKRGGERGKDWWRNTMKKWRERREDRSKGNAKWSGGHGEGEGQKPLVCKQRSQRSKRSERSERSEIGETRGIPCTFTSRCVSMADNPSDNSSIDSSIDCKFVIGARNILPSLLGSSHGSRIQIQD